MNIIVEIFRLTFLATASVVFVFIGIAFINRIRYSDGEYVSMDEEVTENISYLKEMKKIRNEKVYTLINLDMGTFLAFDSNHGVMREVKMGEQDGSKLTIFTEEELNSFGYTKQESGKDNMHWVRITYDIDLYDEDTKEIIEMLKKENRVMESADGTDI